MNKVAVIIPCYNEEMTIAKVVKDFQKILPAADIYVYNNNSKDNTVGEALSVGAIIRNCYIQGKGVAIRQAFKEIDADIYLIVDGNDTYSAKDAPKMITLIKNGAGMVIGDRLSSTYFTENKRPFHNFGNKFVRYLVNRFFSTNIHINDVMTGYRALSKRCAKDFPCTSDGFEIETELTAWTLHNNLNIKEFPIFYQNRQNGSKSKLNTYKDRCRVMKMALKLACKWKYKERTEFYEY